MGYGESEDGVSVKSPNAEQHSNSGGSDDDSGPLEDVTICDICGDAGREDLLVVCSKCSDGAEHTYCMRTRLDEVPEEWICEDCSRLKEPPQDFDMFGQSIVKAYPIIGPKHLGTGKNFGEKESSSPHADGPLGVVDPALSKRKRTPVDYVPLMPNKALRCQDTVIKQNSELSTSDGGTSRQVRQNGSLPPVSGKDFSKSNRLPTETGALTKSKSFSIWDKRPKTRLLDKTPVYQKKKVSAIRSLRKSVSFGDSVASDRSVLDTKTTVAPLRKVSELNELKRSRSMKSGDSLEKATKPEFGRLSQILPLEGRPPVVVTSEDKKAASSVEIGSTHGTKICDRRSFGNTKESENPCEIKKVSSPSKSMEHLASPCVVQDKVPAPEKQQITKTRDSILSGSTTLDERSGTYSSQKVTADHSTIPQPRDIPSGLVLDLGRVKHMENSSLMDPSLPFGHLIANRPLAVPMFDYIWKGEFVVKGSRLPRLSYRIHAYLSTLASLRIPEVVKEFSDKIILDEVSRLSTWPKRFLEHQPQDESIGLYFFAEDIHSYTNYKSLLRCMIDYDLALKGNFNGFELLIFSSNLLPEKSQPTSSSYNLARALDIFFDIALIPFEAPDNHCLHLTRGHVSDCQLANLLISCLPDSEFAEQMQNVVTKDMASTSLSFAELNSHGWNAD